MQNDLSKIDYQAFARDLAALRAEIDEQLGPDDLRHLEKIERWGRLCAGFGYATAWIAPNPISAVLLSLGSTSRWTIVMHHVGHRGMDKVPGVPERLTSKRFAAGSRRFVDWFDWVLPEAWHHEHDFLHHYHTGETADPDLVEDNLRWLRDAPAPRALKYAVIGLFACTWKLTYYAPNTYQALRHAERRRASRGAAEAEAAPGSNAAAFNPLTADGRAFWKRCVLPYAAARFGAAPLAFAPLGPWAVFSVFVNSVTAEVLTNLHTFLVIAPNHAGDDLYRFDEPIKDRAEFFVRQAAGSANYRCGGDVNDFLHGWLNYQIEHHIWPDLPPLKYQQVQPKVKAICEKHGVPYVQEGVLRRAKKLFDVMVGKTSMRRAATRVAKAVKAVAQAAPAD